MARVGIGLPVHNGERFLEQVLDSLLSQTFADLEVVICDNASTDRTPEICQRYAERDTRVKLHRSPENVGAAQNFNRTFGLSTCEYFKWAAADDLILPEYLEECVRVLDSDPSVVVVHTEVQFIDENGKVVQDYDPDLDGSHSDLRQQRFGALISQKHWCFDVFGLIRVSALARTPLIAGYIASDRNLLAELSLLGRYHHVDRVLFLSRDHDDRSIRAMAMEERGAWFNPALEGRIVFPHFRQLWEYVRTIHRVPLGIRERVGCYFKLLSWIRHFRFLLWRDLRAANRKLWRRRHP